MIASLSYATQDLLCWDGTWRPGYLITKTPTADVFKDDHQILSDLLDAEWTELISCMERRRFPPNTRILQAGDFRPFALSDRQWHRQNRRRHSKGQRHIASIGEGSVFGEMAFFDGAPRSAHVFADQEVEVLRLASNASNNLPPGIPTLPTS